MLSEDHLCDGYRALSSTDGAHPEWLLDFSFLTGASGVALALHAATTDQEPQWDRLLLLSA